MKKTADERIEALQKVAGHFLFFAQQGLIAMERFQPGEIITGLAQVSMEAGMEQEDWDAVLAIAVDTFNGAMAGADKVSLQEIIRARPR